MLEFNQNILSKYPLKKASLDFKTTGRQRKDMFRSMRCDPKTKCKMAKIHNEMIDNSAQFLYQLFWQYLCFAKHFRSFVNLRIFWWQYGRWHHLSQTQLASCSPSSGLDSWKFCNYSNEWPKTSPWYSHLLSGLYHLGNNGCMGFDGVRRQFWSLTDASRQSQVAEVC